MRLVVFGETFHAWIDNNLKPVNIEKRMSELYRVFITLVKNRLEDKL